MSSANTLWNVHLNGIDRLLLFCLEVIMQCMLGHPNLNS